MGSSGDPSGVIPLKWRFSPGVTTYSHFHNCGKHQHGETFLVILRYITTNAIASFLLVILLLHFDFFEEVIRSSVECCILWGT